MEKERFTPKEKAIPSGVWRGHAAKFIRQCAESLQETPDALSWLEKHGISKETAWIYQVGWNQKDSYRPRSAWGLNFEILDENGASKKLYLPAGLVVPAFNVERELIRIQILRGSEGVHIVAGSVMIPGWLNPERRTMMVVRNDLEAILVAGCQETVGAISLAGLRFLGPDDATHRKLTGPDAPFLLLHVDEDALRFWRKIYPNARVWPLPEGDHFGSLAEAVKNGFDLATWIEAGLPPGLQRRKEDLQEEGSKLDGLPEVYRKMIAAWRTAGHPKPRYQRALDALKDGEPIDLADLPKETRKALAAFRRDRDCRVYLNSKTFESGCFEVIQ